MKCPYCQRYLEGGQYEVVCCAGCGMSLAINDGAEGAVASPYPDCAEPWVTT